VDGRADHSSDARRDDGFHDFQCRFQWKKESAIKKGRSAVINLGRKRFPIPVGKTAAARTATRPAPGKCVPVPDHQPESGSIPCHGAALSEIFKCASLPLKISKWQPRGDNDSELYHLLPEVARETPCE